MRQHEIEDRERKRAENYARDDRDTTLIHLGRSTVTLADIFEAYGRENETKPTDEKETTNDNRRTGSRIHCPSD